MAALSVTNDLQTPIEVKLQSQSDEWKVVYPKTSCNVGALDGVVTSVEVRWRERPEVTGSCQAASGSSLQASLNFGPFSQESKGRDRAEARELARERKRREDAQTRMDTMIQLVATKKRDAAGFNLASGAYCVIGAFCIMPPLALLALCAAIPPENADEAALLASATVPLCCCLSFCSVLGGLKRARDDFRLGRYADHCRIGFHLLGLLSLALLTAMTAQHALQGFGWTAAILWPVPIFLGGGCSCLLYFNNPARQELDDESVLTRDRELREARVEVSNRTIRFEGSVIRERGRPCVASWPGKYAGAWESLVSQGQKGEVSAAVVFLPHGTDDYGKCDRILETEGLPGTCWCTPLYGEQKPWGCHWFTKWRENIEAAVESGAELEVYYFQNHVGKGKVDSFDTAGDDNLERERLNRKQEEFEKSPQFRQAMDAGLGNLSEQPRGDGSSQYSREARRLFLASLPEAERQFLAASEGLGNSQKAEVAWLEKKGYAYWEVDVSTWLPGEGVERYVPASAKGQLQGRGHFTNPNLDREIVEDLHPHTLGVG